MDVDAGVGIEDSRRQVGHRRVDEHRLCLAVVKDVGDLAGGKVSVHCAVVESGKLAAPSDFEELRAVRKHQCDPVAAPQPGFVKNCGHPPAPGVQLAIGDCVAVRDDHGPRLRGADRVVANVHGNPSVLRQECTSVRRSTTSALTPCSCSAVAAASDSCKLRP